MERASVSVVIPSLNASDSIDELLSALERQTVRVSEILVIDSSSEDDTVERARRHRGVRVVSIDREKFDHGGTRKQAVSFTSGSLILCMTQDAVPADEKMIEAMLRPFEDEDVAMVTARQLPKADAREYVRFVQEFNYPKKSNCRTRRDIESMGLKAYFASDSCTMYRRRSYDAVGGFEDPCTTNEDMLIACRFLKAGFKVAYEATACVYHSHNLTFKAQLDRNVEIGKFLRKYDGELSVPSEVSEGTRLVKYVVGRLIDKNDVAGLMRFALDCVARFVGNRIGRFMRFNTLRLR